MDINSNEMTVENMRLKIENQSKLIKELTTENEELYHQYNHLIIRNGKMLKRIDDLQEIINDLHIRIEELQLINGNMMNMNDKLRNRREIFAAGHSVEQSTENRTTNDSIYEESFEDDIDLEDLFQRWKEYPGQIAQNEPNLRKQILMLIHLYKTPRLKAAELFNKAGVGGVTGARYVSTLKKYGLIVFSGARKKGYYEITKSGRDFILNNGEHEVIRKLSEERAQVLTESQNTETKRKIANDTDPNDL